MAWISQESLIRPYEEGRDFPAVERMWQEVGWMDDAAKQAPHLREILDSGRCLTATVGDEAECLAHVVPGSIWLGSSPLPMCAVAAVMTSRIGRRRGLAKRLTAQQLAYGAGQGAAVAALGMFDQGFYDELGFGSGSYQHRFDFDPATLTVDVPLRTPSRLTLEHWREMHAAMANRLKNHGACVLDSPEFLKADLAWNGKGFGLGYFDGDALSHFLWLTYSDDPEHGPYRVLFWAYRSREELLELMALLKSLSDQVSSISMQEPAHLQLQDLLEQPIRNLRQTQNSPFANLHRSLAIWQIRALDIPVCVSALVMRGPEVKFNLQLTDPVADYLEPDGWRGVAGDYVVCIGGSSSAEPGNDARLPTLNATVGAFTRMLFGFVSASNLSASDDLSGPGELLDALDGAIALPRAVWGWDF
ncbi:MAG: hypothetical protein CMQ49_01035 [Gammaproteobacteria bacterium]|nr:hypothetical protein [Gammaproteobacteria bacterium]